MPERQRDPLRLPETSQPSSGVRADQRRAAAWVRTAENGLKEQMFELDFIFGWEISFGFGVWVLFEALPSVLVISCLFPYCCFRSRLHTFREVPHFRMLVCGGDGTVGWVLGVLETIRHKLACPEPAISIVPLGTGTHCLYTQSNEI